MTSVSPCKPAARLRGEAQNIIKRKNERKLNVNQELFSPYAETIQFLLLFHK